MAIVSIKDNQLVITMERGRKIGLKSDFSVPLAKVTGVAVDTKAWDKTPTFGEKEWGADLYGIYFGGVFVRDGRRIFYDLKRNEQAVVIELKDGGENYHKFTPHLKPLSVYEDFSKIILGADFPDGIIKIIEDAIQHQG